MRTRCADSFPAGCCELGRRSRFRRRQTVDSGDGITTEIRWPVLRTAAKEIELALNVKHQPRLPHEYKWRPRRPAPPAPPAPPAARRRILFLN
ncbi:hypothetical protein EVAR_78360_1 [Eumeta japonica]|uniref:Uncharacterized protein n=1 Tax=Eumeta variegata TaxID=151549 RepID=A0A4C1T3C6_EUMVA|nr:hypothetical protein EVAR_78360_1 [Eumeta japonica]